MTKEGELTTRELVDSENDSTATVKAELVRIVVYLLVFSIVVALLSGPVIQLIGSYYKPNPHIMHSLRDVGTFILQLAD